MFSKRFFQKLNLNALNALNAQSQLTSIDCIVYSLRSWNGTSLLAARGPQKILKAKLKTPLNRTGHSKKVHVIELQMGHIAPEKSVACSPILIYPYPWGPHAVSVQ